MSEQPTPLTVERLYALRYLTIAGLTVLIYDALLTCSEELRFIWSPILWKIRQSGIRKLRIPRPIMLYLIARYCMLAIGLLYLYDLIPSMDLSINWVRPLLDLSIRSTTLYTSLSVVSISPCQRCADAVARIYTASRCQGSAVFIFCVDVIVEVLSCGVVLHQLFQLWAFNRIISRIVLVVFFLSKVVLFAFAAAAIYLIKQNITFMSAGHVRFCGVTGSSRLFLGVWITCVTFDVFAFVLLLLNALSKPRSESQRLLTILYEDGIIFFLTIFTMRSMNLIISAAAPPPLIILAIVFSASMVSTVVSRSFLRLQRRLTRGHYLSKLPYSADESFFDDDDFEREGEGEYILTTSKNAAVNRDVKMKADKKGMGSGSVDDSTMRSAASSNMW